MNLIFLTFVFPLIGFLLLSFSRGRWSENLSALIGEAGLDFELVTEPTPALEDGQLGQRIKVQNLSSCGGIYHFCGDKALTWCDFAKQIFINSWEMNNEF